MLGYGKHWPIIQILLFLPCNFSPQEAYMTQKWMAGPNLHRKMHKCHLGKNTTCSFRMYPALVLLQFEQCLILSLETCSWPWLLRILWWLHRYYLTWYSEKPLLWGRAGLIVPILQATELPKGHSAYNPQRQESLGCSDLLTSCSEVFPIPNIVSLLTKSILFKYTQSNSLLSICLIWKNLCFEASLC